MTTPCYAGDTPGYQQHYKRVSTKASNHKDEGNYTMRTTGSLATQGIVVDEDLTKKPQIYFTCCRYAHNEKDIRLARVPDLSMSKVLPNRSHSA